MFRTMKYAFAVLIERQFCNQRIDIAPHQLSTSFASSSGRHWLAHRMPTVREAHQFRANLRTASPDFFAAACGGLPSVHIILGMNCCNFPHPGIYCRSASILLPHLERS